MAKKISELDFIEVQDEWVDARDNASQLYAAFNEAERWAKEQKEYYRQEVGEQLKVLHSMTGVDRMEVVAHDEKIATATLVMKDASFAISDQNALNDFALAHGLAREVPTIDLNKDWQKYFAVQEGKVVFKGVDPDTGEIHEQQVPFLTYIHRQPAYPKITTTKEFKQAVSERLNASIMEALAQPQERLQLLGGNHD